MQIHRGMLSEAGAEGTGYPPGTIVAVKVGTLHWHRVLPAAAPEALYAQPLPLSCSAHCFLVQYMHARMARMGLPVRHAQQRAHNSQNAPFWPARPGKASPCAPHQAVVLP